MTQDRGLVPDLRHALAQCAATVCVVTAGPRGDVRGTTVTSAIGVALSPPSVLFSLHAKSRVLERLRREGRFGLTLLAEDQEPLARLCSDSARGAIPESALSGAESGAPRISHGAASVEGSVAHTLEVGDHVLVVGLVTRAEYGAARPLLYHDRRYRRLS